MVRMICVLLVVAVMGTAGTTWYVPAAAADLQAAEELLSQAEELVNQARYREAQEFLQRMLTSCGDHELCQAAALFWIARCHLESGQYMLASDLADQAFQKYQALEKPLEQGMAMNLQARIHQARNDYSQALKLYDQAEELIKKNGGAEHPELFAILANRTRIHIYQNNYELALRDADKAEKLLGTKTNAHSLGILKEHRGLIAADQGRYSEAKGFYDEALKLYQETQNQAGQTAVHNKRGRLYEYQGEYTEALKEYEHSLTIARAVGNTSDEAFALNNLGMLHRKRGNYLKASETYDAALSLRDKSREPQFYAETLANKALANYFIQSDPERSIRTFQECYEIAQAAGVPGTQARALHNLAYLMRDQGKFRESRELSQEAIYKARQMGHRRFEAQALLRLGNLYELYGGYDDALQCYEDARDIQTKVGDQFFLSATLMDMANIETRAGRTKKAEKHLEEALNIRRRIEAPLAEVMCKTALFNLENYRYSDRKESKPSKDNYQRALKNLRMAEKELNRSMVDDAMLVAYVAGRYATDLEPQEAVRRFQELRDLAERSNRLRYKFLSSIGLGSAYEALGQLAQAEEEYQRAVHISETLRQSLDVQSQKTFLDGEPILGVKYASAYEGLARVRMNRNDWIGSLEASEATKARAFADKLAQSLDESSFGVDKSMLNELREVETQIRNNLRRLEECRAPEGDKSAIPGLESERNQIDQEFKRIKEQLRINYPEFFASRFPQPVSIRDGNIPSGQLLLVYEVTDTGFITYFCKGNRIDYASFRAIPRWQLEDLLLRYREPMETLKDYGDLDQLDLTTGNELAELLLREVRDRIEPGKTLLLILDDCLELLPFEMLVLNKTGRMTERAVKISGGKEIRIPATKGVEFFGEKNPLVYYQSLSALNLARSASKSRGVADKLLVIADVIVPSVSGEAAPVEGLQGSSPAVHPVEALAGLPGFETAPGEPQLLSAATYKKLADSFEPLEETRKLAEDLKALFREKAFVFTKQDATLKNFQQTVAPVIGEYGQIIFATHGYFGDRFRPEIHEPVLLMSCSPPLADNLLRMSTVMSLNLNAQIVTLLACQTGLGRHVAGEGTMGMGRAFQYAGAKSVLMSMWSIDEKPSVLLVKYFMEELASGKSKTDSLQAARKSLRAAGYDHPFFWSAFILVGEDL